jgi:hypothetical protein
MRIDQYTQASIIVSGDRLVILKDPATDPKLQTIDLDDLADALSLLVVNKADLKYVASLTQTGTAAPVVTVLKDDIEIVWTRQSSAVFYGTSAGLFKLNKTTFDMPDQEGIVSWEILDVNTVKITCEDDGVLNNHRVEINVYA